MLLQINLHSGMSNLIFNYLEGEFVLQTFAWKWLTTVPEVHGAQGLPDSDYGAKNVICPLFNPVAQAGTHPHFGVRHH